MKRWVDFLFQFEWAFTGIYGPNSDLDRRLLWEELAGIRNWWSVPWCFSGDFNVVRFPSEHSGSSPFSSAMVNFSDFISELGLIDLPFNLKGVHLLGLIPERWLRVLGLTGFYYLRIGKNIFRIFVKDRLQMLLSDHFPILLKGGNFQRDSRPFRFENTGLKADGFVNRMRCW